MVMLHGLPAAWRDWRLWHFAWRSCRVAAFRRRRATVTAGWWEAGIRVEGVTARQTELWKVSEAVLLIGRAAVGFAAQNGMQMATGRCAVVIAHARCGGAQPRLADYGPGRPGRL